MICSSHRILASTAQALVLLTAVAACTRTQAPSSLKIRDGRQVSPSSQGPERRSTAAIRGEGASGSYICSAAIIGLDLLATAGHCVEPGAQLNAFFGENLNDEGTGTFLAAANTAVDPAFNSGESLGGLPLGDVALIRLDGQIPSGYRPIAVLPDDHLLTANEAVLLAGYGITEQGDDSGVLRYTYSTYIGPDGAGRLQIDDPEQRGACSGDSGGPLFAQSSGRWYVAGVLSGGPVPCRGVNVYTSLAAHREFIHASAAAFSE